MINALKTTQFIFTKKVIPPRDIKGMSIPVLITSSKYCDDIENFLIDMGYDKSLIYKSISPNAMGL